jgi:hypothetical protein
MRRARRYAAWAFKRQWVVTLQGWDAHERGEPLTANPYLQNWRLGAVAHAYWLQQHRATGNG